MRSKINAEFRRLYKELPPDIRNRARRAYLVWQENPRHPSLHFKCVSDSDPIYSVRIDANYRALGVIRKDAIIWFWIGSHAEYERMLKQD